MNIERIIRHKIRRCYLVYFVMTLSLLAIPWLYTYSSAEKRAAAQQFIQIANQQSTLVRSIALNLYRSGNPIAEIKTQTLKRQTIVLMNQFNDNHTYLVHSDLPRTVYQGGNNSLHDLFSGDKTNIDTLTSAFFAFAKQTLESTQERNAQQEPVLPTTYFALTDRLERAEVQFQQNLAQSNRHMVNVSIFASIFSLIVFIMTIIALIYPIEKLLLRIIAKFADNSKRTYQVNREAHLAIKAKSQFLSNMSHELRSPISGMFGMLELAQQEPDSAKQNVYLQKAQSAGHQLLSLVDEILDISRIEAKVLTFENIDFELIKVLDTVIAPITASAEKKGLEFSFCTSTSLPDFVKGDPLRLSQALQNVVNNAIKFTEKGGVSINVKLDIVNRKYQLNIFVSDTGIGIATEDHSRVFEKFTQVTKGENNSVSGTGLGLTIAKEFAEGLGGTLTLNSAIGKGSTFKLSVPLGKSTQKAQLTYDDAAHIAQAKFAVIDDLETSRLYIANILQNDGFEVDVFESASKFLLKKDAILDYAGLIIDIHMPGFNGYELAETIHAMFDNSAPPFIFISASPESINHTQLKFVDMWQGFAKPMDKNRFIDSIRILARKNILKTEAFVPARVLLVEDEPINAEVVKTMLERNGHTVELADTGTMALHLATTKEFNLILMDINLPDMSGIETTRSIKARGVETEIVALTGNAYEEDKLRTKEAGMAYHLVKPVMFHELNNVIKLALRAPS